VRDTQRCGNVTSRARWFCESRICLPRDGAVRILALSALHRELPQRVAKRVGRVKSYAYACAAVAASCDSGALCGSAATWLRLRIATHSLQTQARDSRYGQRHSDLDNVCADMAGGFTSLDPESRRVVPESNGRPVVKLVYTVLESQYQSALTDAVQIINATNDKVCFEIIGYLLEELRDNKNMENFKADLADANVFIGSLIFIEDLAEKVRCVYGPLRAARVVHLGMCCALNPQCLAAPRPRPTATAAASGHCVDCTWGGVSAPLASAHATPPGCARAGADPTCTTARAQLSSRMRTRAQHDGARAADT
jgi:Domain of unknown function (DUF3479)